MKSPGQVSSETQLKAKKEAFGLRVRSARGSALMTQKQLSTLVGCSQIAISSVERGKCFPSGKNFFRLVEIFGVEKMFPEGTLPDPVKLV